MIIVAFYSHKNALKVLEEHYNEELKEIIECIEEVDASKTFGLKVSEEKTMEGESLYAPKELNNFFSSAFEKRGWKSQVKIPTSTKLQFWPTLNQERIMLYESEHKGFRSMDFVKNSVGVEIQFGKYAFMVYNVAAKMTIFAKHNIIKVGVEIVPMKRMASKMSTGVSYFEQMKADLEMRGESNIDVAALVLGIDDF